MSPAPRETRISSQFWTGTTGRQIVERGPAAQIVALYLMTTERVHDEYGLFRFRAQWVVKDAGLTLEDVEQQLNALAAIEFIRHDRRWIWIREFAWHQVARREHLDAGDRRIYAARRWYRRLPTNPFIADWFDRYAPVFRLQSSERRTEAQPAATLVEPEVEHTVDSVFAELYSRYPEHRRSATDSTLDLFRRRAHIELWRVIPGLERHLVSAQWQTPQYVPTMRRWIDERRWRQTPSPPPRKSLQARVTDRLHQRRGPAATIVCDD
jgi:hypothetical protein